jgi:hypothetical protein
MDLQLADWNNSEVSGFAIAESAQEFYDLRLRLTKPKPIFNFTVTNDRNSVCFLYINSLRFFQK